MMRDRPTRGLLALALLLGTAAGTLVADTFFRDDFTDGTLGEWWTVLNRNDAYMSVTGGLLSLRCSNGDLYQSTNNAKNVLLIPTPMGGDFDVILAVQHFEPIQGGWAQVDLLAFDDVDNHYRGGYGNLFDLNNTRYLTNAREVGGVYIGTGNTLHNFYAAPFYLRVTKRGTAYHLYYSLNGLTYLDSGLGTNYGDGTPAYLGLVAMADQSQTSVATIDYFAVVSKPVGDCNGDFDIDFEDFGALAECVAGPNLPYGSGCGCSDLDADGDSDLCDVALFQRVFTGS